MRFHYNRTYVSHPLNASPMHKKIRVRKNVTQIDGEIKIFKKFLVKEFPELENIKCQFEFYGLSYKLRPTGIPDELMNNIRQRFPQYCL